MDHSIAQQMLKSGQVDAIFGYINTVWFSAKAVGFDPEKDLRFINYGDHGLDLYSNTIVVSKQLAKDNPNAVKGLLVTPDHPKPRWARIGRGSTAGDAPCRGKRNADRRLREHALWHRRGPVLVRATV